MQGGGRVGRWEAQCGVTRSGAILDRQPGRAQAGLQGLGGPAPGNLFGGCYSKWVVRCRRPEQAQAWKW